MYDRLEEPVRRFADRQHHDAYKLLDAVRIRATGLYSDAYDTFAQRPVRMGSIAATGVGLAGLAVAHVEGWDPAAGPKAVATLKSVNQGAAPRHRGTGFFYHFHDLETGEVWRGSEISTIDTAILVAGARLAAHHLGPEYPEVKEEADILLHSIQWDVALGEPETGVIYMVIQEDGTAATPGRPFNEYAIVASLAHAAQPDHRRVQEFWRRVYAPEAVESLPTREYHGIRVLVDSPTSFLSSFVCQFPLYLVPEYTGCEAYHRLVKGAALADRVSWQIAGSTPAYVWGHGAGANDGLPAEGDHRPGYAVDAINRSSGVASAYIIAGFLPVHPEGIYDLYAWYKLHIPYDDYVNPGDLEDERALRAAYRFGLGRFSWEHRRPPHRWYPRLVTVIDWSTMLYGLTALKRGLGFFALGS